MRKTLAVTVLLLAAACGGKGNEASPPTVPGRRGT
jgi:hypothetical protein